MGTATLHLKRPFAEVLECYGARGPEVIAVLPFDEEVVEADRSGTPILDADPESSYVIEVEQLLGRLPLEELRERAPNEPSLR